MNYYDALDLLRLKRTVSSDIDLKEAYEKSVKLEKYDYRDNARLKLMKIAYKALSDTHNRWKYARLLFSEFSLDCYIRHIRKAFKSSAVDGSLSISECSSSPDSFMAIARFTISEEGVILISFKIDINELSTIYEKGNVKLVTTTDIIWNRRYHIIGKNKHRSYDDLSILYSPDKALPLQSLLRIQRKALRPFKRADTLNLFRLLFEAEVYWEGVVRIELRPENARIGRDGFLLELWRNAEGRDCVDWTASMIHCNGYLYQKRGLFFRFRESCEAEFSALVDELLRLKRSSDLELKPNEVFDWLYSLSESFKP